MENYLLPGRLSHFWVYKTHTYTLHGHTPSPTGHGFILPLPWRLLGDHSNETTTLSFTSLASKKMLTVKHRHTCSRPTDMHTDTSLQVLTCETSWPVEQKRVCMSECMCGQVRVENPNKSVHFRSMWQLLARKYSLLHRCKRVSVWSEKWVFCCIVVYLSAWRGAYVRVKVSHLWNRIPNIFQPSAQFACVYLWVLVCNI